MFKRTDSSNLVRLPDKIIYDNLKQMYESGYDYHTLKFPDGFVLEGRFDMSKYLQFFNIPNDLKNKTVLDIGSANGFFSFEFDKRGANVTAIDQDNNHWNEKFNELMNTNVNFKVQNINDIDTSQKYDIVFCCNVLQHNSDMLGIIKKIKDLTKERAIISTQVLDNPKSHNVSLARFIGKSFTKYKPPLQVFWRPNMPCLKMMAEFVGFNKIEEYPTFEIQRNTTLDKSLYGVIHCFN